MIDLPITRRENWIRMLKHETPMWMPMYSDTCFIMPSHVPDNIARAMVVEAEPWPIEKVGGPDMFGIPWVYVPTVHGSMEDPDVPHLLEDVSEWREKVKFPDMDAWDWAGAAERNRDFLDRSRFTTTWFFSGMFERLISFMGFENAAMALIDDDCEDDLHALLDALADNCIEFTRRFKQWFDIDCLYFHDDWGSQRSPFFSVRVAREKLVPHLRRISDWCHANGMFFELHCCGMIEDLMPAMIEAGVDNWCGQSMNDKVGLFDKYGDRIAVGETLMWGPDNTKEEVYAKADRVIEHIRPVRHEKTMYFMEMVMNKDADAEALRDYIRSKTLGMYD